MCKKNNTITKDRIWSWLLFERLFANKADHKQIVRPTLEGIPTLPPRNRLVLDPDSRYRHNGVDGWRFQGYDLEGKILLSTDVYKQVDLQDLRALNQELGGEGKPRIGASYQIRRSSGSLEQFLFLAVNADTQKLMMIKPEGHTESVSEEELAQENLSWWGERLKTAH